MVEDWVKLCMKTLTTGRNHPDLGLGGVTARLGQEGGVGRSGIKKGGRKDGGGGRDQDSGRLHTGLSLPVSSGARSQGQSRLTLVCSSLLLLTVQLDQHHQHFLGPTQTS